MLRRDPRVPCPTRWQPHCGSARAGWGRTVVGTAPEACPLPRACSRGSTSPVRSGCRDRGALERRLPASCAAPGRPAGAPSPCHVLAVAAQRAACSAVLGTCRHCPRPTASFHWRRFCISQLTRCPAGCRCVRASERLQLWQPGSFLSPPASWCSLDRIKRYVQA